MRFGFLEFFVCVGISWVGVGCAGLRKPWMSERRGLLDRSPQVAERDAEDSADSGAGVTGADQKGSEGERSGEGDFRHTRTQFLHRETVRYFRGKKKRSRIYAKEVKPVSEDLDLQWPLASVEVSSHFGQRGRSFHEGIDLRAKVGTEVRAAQAGRVLYASSKIRGYGKMIVIRHAGKLATIYAHNSTLLVKRGDYVHQGQEIARTGNTGHSTGPHLHFEVRRDVAALNPLQVLPHSRPFSVSSASDSSHVSASRSHSSKRSGRRSS